MEPCRVHEETLLLDVYGELGANERAAWEKHLEACPACREEREKIIQLLHRVRQTTPVPHLSRQEADALSQAVKRKLADSKDEGRWWDRRVSVSVRTLAAATACCVIFISGWLAARWMDSSSRDLGSTRAVQLSQKDMELIRNLELLEELETLRKLVHVIDQEEALSRRPEI